MVRRQSPRSSLDRHLPPNPARTAVFSGALERRVAHLERCLPPASADGWVRVGDPAAEIRSLLVAARREATEHNYVAAVAAWAEAERRYWAHAPMSTEPSIRVKHAQLRSEINLQVEQIGRLTRGAKKGAQNMRGKSAQLRRDIIRKACELLTRKAFREISGRELARALRNPPHSISLSTERIRKVLREAGLPPSHKLG